MTSTIMTNPKKDPKDPWHYDNIEGTLKKRKESKNDILATIRTMDANVYTEIGKVLQKHSKDGSIQMTLLQENHKDYNAKAAAEVETLIDKLYSLDSQFHPLKGKLNLDKLEDNYFNKQMIEELYTPHKEQIKRAVKKSNFDQILQGTQQQNIRRLDEKLDDQTTKDIDAEKHGEGMLKYFLDLHKVDKSKLSGKNMDYLKNNVASLAMNHNAGHLNKDAIYDMASNYK
jgi:hypothetical protein